MLVYYAVLVRVWTYCKDVDKMCDFGGLEMDKVWTYCKDVDKLVWKRFLHPLHEVYGSRVYKWVTIMWANIKDKQRIMRKRSIC